MAAKSAFRQAMEAAVDERHCADHPMSEQWARGEISKSCLMGWAVEQFHWVSNVRSKDFYICAHAPNDVIGAQMGTRHEEIDPEHSHLDIMLRFAAANGADVAAVKVGRGLPTTRSFVAWIDNVAITQPWYAAIAATKVASESQSPRLYSKVLPALRDTYKLEEPDIEHFWLHSEVDIEHGDEGYELLERHCTTSEQQEICIYYAREGARMRWFHFDGIYLHYEKGYALQ